MSERKKAYQVINENSLFRTIYESVDRPRDKSVISPSAQTIKLCDSGTGQDTILTALSTIREQLMVKNQELWYIIDLMVSGALRVSEVLSITCNNITQTGHVLVKAGKGSNDRVVFSAEAKEFLLRCKGRGRQPFLDWNRFRVYRDFKKYNISMHIAGKTNNSVTHSLRQLVSRQLQLEGIPDTMRSKVLGHKSVSSLDHYSDGRREKH